MSPIDPTDPGPPRRESKYNVHPIRKLLVWIFIIGFWLIFYWTRS